jgi:hypothetical protein
MLSLVMSMPIFASANVCVIRAISGGYVIRFTVANSPARRSGATSKRLRWLNLLVEPSPDNRNRNDCRKLQEVAGQVPRPGLTEPVSKAGEI